MAEPKRTWQIIHIGVGLHSLVLDISPLVFFLVDGRQFLFNQLLSHAHAEVLHFELFQVQVVVVHQFCRRHKAVVHDYFENLLAHHSF